MCERDFGKEPEYTVSQIHTFYLEYCKRNNYRYPKGMKEFRDRLMEYLDWTFRYTKTWLVILTGVRVI